MGDGIAQFAAFIDGTGCFRSHMAGNASGEGELLAQPLQSVHILAHIGIYLAVGSLKIRVCHEKVAAVPGPGNEDHIQIVFFYGTVQMRIYKVLSGHCSPVSHNFFLNILKGKRPAKQRVVQQIQLCRRQIIGCAPIGVHLLQILLRQRLLFSNHCVFHCFPPRRVPTRNMLYPYYFPFILSQSFFLRNRFQNFRKIYQTPFCKASACGKPCPSLPPLRPPQSEKCPDFPVIFGKPGQSSSTICQYGQGLLFSTPHPPSLSVRFLFSR